MKFLNKNMHKNPSNAKKKTSLVAHVQDRINHIGRKMSKGASNIYKMMRTHAKWGNKQLWGFREKGRHKPR